MSGLPARSLFSALVALGLGIAVGAPPFGQHADAAVYGGMDPDWCSGTLRQPFEIDVAQPHDPPMQTEHDAMMALVPIAQATHTAVANGAWSTTSTWSNAQIPNANARVVIPTGLRVIYDAATSPQLRTVRIDGELAWANDRETHLLVDTIVVPPGGRITIGTTDAPMRADVSAHIVFADRGPIDTVWDPQRLSRGLLSHGKARIRGASKRSFAALSAPVLIGATQITLVEDLTGWRVGDQIVVTGTRKRGWMWDGSGTSYMGTDDEVRTITAINVHTLTLSSALSHNHQAPEADLKVYVANLSRNIIFETENAASVPTQQRGHVMFMHEADVRVEFAQFLQLGRSDKNLVVDDVGLQVDGSPGTGSNPRGRYALHMHRSGARDAFGIPAMLHGNSLIGSPGWGFVNHDSYALIEDNVAYDVFGAAFVTEIGNEMGTFKRNLAVRSHGSGRHFKIGVELHDLAHSGHGFWFQGRNLVVEDNVAVGQAATAFMYFHRSAIFLEYVDRDDLLRFPQIVKSNPEVGYPRAPIVDNRRNLAYASDEGLRIVKAEPHQLHDMRNLIEDFTSWNANIGIALEYVSDYVLRRPRLIANADDWHNAWAPGIDLGNNVVFDVVIDHPSIRGFGPAVTDLPIFDGSPDLTNVTVIAPNFVDNLPDGASATGPITNGIQYFDASLHRILSEGQVTNTPVSFAVAANQNFNMPTTLAWNTAFVLSGSKTDSLGEITISSEWNGEDLRFRMLPTGYYTRGDGAKIYRFRELFADRLYGTTVPYAYDVVIPAGFGYPLGPNLGAPPSEANALPIASPDALSVGRGDIDGLEAIVIESASLLGNDSDANGDALRVDVPSVTAPAHGAVSVLPNGNLAYFPNAGFVGADQFTYRVSDGKSYSAPATVTLNVQSTSDLIFANGFQ